MRARWTFASHFSPQWRNLDTWFLPNRQCELACPGSNQNFSCWVTTRKKKKTCIFPHFFHFFFSHFLLKNTSPKKNLESWVGWFCWFTAKKLEELKHNSVRKSHLFRPMNLGSFRKRSYHTQSRVFPWNSHPPHPHPTHPTLPPTPPNVFRRLISRILRLQYNFLTSWRIFRSKLQIPQPSWPRNKTFPYGEFLSPGQGISLVVRTGICSQKLESKNFWAVFFIFYVINRIDTSFRYNFSHFWTIFSHFWCAFCIFYDQAELKQTPNHSIKIFHMANFYRLVRASAWSRNLEFCTKNRNSKIAMSFFASLTW